MGYARGDLVKVTITNVKVVDSMSGGGSFRGVHPEVQYSLRDDRKSDELFFGAYGDVKVESVRGSREPDFDPKVGDIYQADGELWFARKSTHSGSRFNNYIVISNVDGTTYSNDPMNIRDEFASFQRKMPKLLVRNGEDVSKSSSVSAW